MSAFTFQKWVDYIYNLQDEICISLEKIDNDEVFREDIWERNEGGGGRSRIISNGSVFEKGGVNVSFVHGLVNETMTKSLGISGHKWAAAGLSMVIHPLNPFVPTYHANWRYFELYDEHQSVIDSWFGGGMDLTPYYFFLEDALHFHRTLYDTFAPFHPKMYRTFKKQCDDYFNNHHRGVETRGIGGVFYDHLRENDDWGLSKAQLFELQKSCSKAFFEAYIPLVNHRKDDTFSGDEKFWQEIRRGRYVEFNLLHDRGTLFGLKTNGRIESILMSLPPTVRYEYNYEPEKGSREAAIMDIFRNPRVWIEEDDN